MDRMGTSGARRRVTNATGTLATGAAALGLVLGSASLAGASPSRPTTLQTARAITSSNPSWSGYVVPTAGSTDVAGSWTVPAVDPTRGDGGVQTWIGLGSQQLIQVGTRSSVVSGHAVYQPFWNTSPTAEPAYAPEPTFAVQPGDEMAAEIEPAPGSAIWRLDLTDETTAQGWALNVHYSPDQNAAEWIQGAEPSGPVIPFSPVTFRALEINDHAPALTESEGVELIPAGSATSVSTPSAPSSERAAFTVSYGSTEPVTPPSPHNRVVTAKDGQGHVHIFLIGEDRMVHMREELSPGHFSAGQIISGRIPVDDSIGVGLNTDGSLQIFVIATFGDLYTNRISGLTAGGWKSLGGEWPHADTIGVATAHGGGPQIFIVGENHQLYTQWATDSQGDFSGRANLGGPWAYTDDITAVSGAGGLDVLMIGNDGKLWEYAHVSNGAAALKSLGGSWNAASSIGAAKWGTSLAVALVGRNDGLYTSIVTSAGVGNGWHHGPGSWPAADDPAVTVATTPAPKSVIVIDNSNAVTYGAKAGKAAKPPVLVLEVGLVGFDSRLHLIDFTAGHPYVAQRQGSGWPPSDSIAAVIDTGYLYPRYVLVGAGSHLYTGYQRTTTGAKAKAPLNFGGTWES